MSLRRYQPLQKSQLKIQLCSVQPSCNGSVITGAESRIADITGDLAEHNTEEPTVGASPACSLTVVVPTEVASSTTTSVIPSRSTTATEAPPVTEQIANLLNLAQHLLSSVREQQQQQRRHRHRQRREARLQERTPYQRPNNELPRATQRHNENGNHAFGINATNVNTVSIGETCTVTNGAANSAVRQQARHTQPRNGGSNTNNCNSGGGEDNINFQCSICLDSYLLHRPMVTQCGHLFCRRCIRQCVSCQGKCPMCNRKLNSSSMFRVYF